MSPVTVWSELLEVIDLALAPFDEPATVLMFLDPGVTGTILRVDGAHGPELLARLGPIIVEATSRQPVAGVAFATCRPCATPTLDDELAFVALASMLDDAGIDLVDWVLVDPDIAISMAEATGFG
jgi:hypothetical protein